MDSAPILLTGATGLLGHWLIETAPATTRIIAVTHRRRLAGIPSVDADLRDAGAAASAVEATAPGLIIHAAYTKDEASIVDATRNVLGAAAVVGATVLYTSSDAVFVGDGRDRDEAAPPDARFDYGRFKAAAEGLVLAASPEHVVVRLPLLVSTDPDDHAVAQTRAAAARGATTRWYDDELRLPAMASDVALAIWRIVALPPAQRGGVWHLAGPERLSRFEIAQRMITRLGLPSACIEPEHRPSDSDRPRDIAFSDRRARREIGWDPTPIG